MSDPVWTPEIIVDAERARALIASRFADVRADRLERLGQGWDNAAYLVDGTAVFRFPQRAVAAPLVATEIAVLPLLAPRLPLAIPVPRWIGRPDESYPWQFAGYALLDGTPLDIALPAANDAVRAALARPLARFLRALHSIDPAPVVAAGLGPDTIGRMDPVKRIPQARKRLAALVDNATIAAAHADAIVEQFMADAADGTVPGKDADHRDDAAPREAMRLVIVHGDLYARHLLVDGSGTLAAVIDWGDVHAGDRAVDLSVAHEILPRSAHAEFLAEYGDVDARTWRRARWRAIHHAILVADYGTAIGDTPLADGGLTALARITDPIQR